ncbi:hypothetical protein KSC_033010 [Ktedonobacter sp. SOSP1-52]|uniref:hypothetical protein n=1 Tax=Ktedonobacter sp. SOSP1-52 TaxID=2778366 RepID=UPI0019162977|nr:hypothetical protein [Ktedonobacter sp. SOSP1-52]GHO64409.1 hypothetical protein KSC_033010 [Ktedonobacter sp. SOSP1-52]
MVCTLDETGPCKKIILNCGWAMAPLELALLNNTALGLMARQGETNLAHAQRTFSYQFYQAVSTSAA